MNYKESLMHATSALTLVAKECSLFEAETLHMHFLCCERIELYQNHKETMPKKVSAKIADALAKRQTGMPLAYVLGVSPFYGYTIEVSHDVLIPRPETEELVEVILENEKGESLKFLDLCTGSGAIAKVLSLSRPLWRGYAFDVSFEALSVAKKNIPETVSLVQADFLNACKEVEFFDFIVCNPPYIESSVCKNLDKQVLDFEPIIALCGGDDGLFFYRQLALKASALLKKGGRLYCEIGSTQKNDVLSIFDIPRFKNILVTKDMSGHERVFRAVVSQ